MPDPVISLTTDFGFADPFIGLMKGVILATAPHARIVDLTHDLPPQAVVDAALVLESAVGYFPKGTIHVAVVDPGVGTDRRAIAIETARYRYVGPDNGIFTAALALEPPINAVELADDQFFHHPVSDTFHGRDIFAPVAAHLANGVKLGDLGPPVTPLAIQLPEPWQVDGNLELHVLRIDRFGNVITDLTEARYREWLNETDADDAGDVICQVGPVVLEGVRRTYGDVLKGRPLTYFGSTGRLEIAIREGHAAVQLGITRDTVIRLARRA
jgi:S-adenosylmethionine hydrolase